MPKKIFTPLAPFRNRRFLTGLENLNYKPIKVRKRKFLTGFIFLIIFLIVFGFFIFDFKNKPQKLEVKASPGTTFWTEPESCSVTKEGCSCSVETGCGSTPVCTKSCPPRQNADLYNGCNYTISGDCKPGDGCVIKGVPRVAICRSGFSCDYQGGACEYTCLTDFENCDGNNTNGCECQKPAGCCDGNIRRYDCAICDGTGCNSDNTCAARVGCLTQDCGTESYCSAGYCNTCPGNCLNCDQDPNSASWDSGCNAGCEMDVSADNNNCGGCGITCDPTENCVNGLCVTTGSQDVWGWAWSENIGWISFNCLNDYNNDEIRDDHCSGVNPETGLNYINYGVNIDEVTGDFSGFAWSENIGWIKFDPPADFDTGRYPCCSSSTCPGGPVSCAATDEWPNYPAHFDSTTRKVTGWARACAGTVNGDCISTTRADGWDGWILLGPIYKWDTDFGVNYVAISSGEFHNWAWEASHLEDSETKGVVGWISFWGNNPTLPSPSNKYTVFTSLTPPNERPYVQSPALDGETYCNISSGVGRVGFKWTYKDDDGDEQSQYWLQVATDSGFSNLVVDSINSQTGIPSGGTGTSAVSVVPSPTADTSNLDIGYNDTYYWRVRVKAATGNLLWSDWVEGSSFTTSAHAYPWVDFTPADGASLPFDSGVVQFCSIFEGGVCPVEKKPDKGWTTCYNINNNEVFCANWNWQFPGGNPATSTSSNQSVTYSGPTDKQADLTVSDSTPYSCTVTHKFKLTPPLTLPEWKEIPPF